MDQRREATCPAGPDLNPELVPSPPTPRAHSTPYKCFCFILTWVQFNTQNTPQRHCKPQQHHGKAWGQTLPCKRKYTGRQT